MAGQRGEGERQLMLVGKTALKLGEDWNEWEGLLRVLELNFSGNSEVAWG